jgi:hypothetical protein
MKAKNLFKLMAILVAVIGISIAGCKKDKTTTPTTTTPDPSSLQQLANDDNQVTASDNEMTNDANGVLSSSKVNSVRSRVQGMDTMAPPANCTITIDTVGSNQVITLVYNGLNTTGTFSKTGTVIITKALGVKWSTQNASVTIQFVNLTITKVSSGKSFIYNGTRTWTNISGGLIVNLGSTSVPTTSVTHQITGNMSITFDNGTQRTWTVNRQRVWTGTFPTALVLSASGFGSSNGYNNCTEYGTNRNGELFYTQVNPSTPVVFSEACLWVPISGVLVHSIPSTPKSGTITYGYVYNSNNNSFTLATSGTCADAYQLAWTWKTYSGTLFGVIL